MPAGRPRLSVIVPCHRTKAFLAGCLDSVLADPRDDVEVIAVDDASPDGTAAILDGRAGVDPRLRVLRLAANGGPGPARNAGLDRASGEYVWFVDSDDWLPPGAVGAVRDRLAETDPDVLIVDHADVFGGVSVPRRAAGLLGGVSPPIALAECPRLLRLAQSACTKVVRRPFLDGIGLRFTSGWYEDALFSPSLLVAAKRIDVLPRICYCYRQQGQPSITTSRSTRHFEIFDQYDRLMAMATEEFQAELFRVMIDHYLVVLGHRGRLPADRRRAFFARMVEDYRRWLPADGYPVPGGAAGLKHRLVRHGAYPAYAALRLAYRVAGRWRAPDRRGR